MQIISIILTYGEEHKTGISALTAGTPGSIPVWGTKILRTAEQLSSSVTVKDPA